MRVARRRIFVVSQRGCLRESEIDFLADRGRNSNPKPAFYGDIFSLYIRTLVAFRKGRAGALIGLPGPPNRRVAIHASIGPPDEPQVARPKWLAPCRSMR
jgi:hypothetical protein